MVLEPAIFDYLDGDSCVLERTPLETLAKEGQLDCYKHNGFWQCMDTLRDKEKLEKMISQGVAPWIYWK
jgi:glucose-1-phosphate cytidylyltransferase